MSRAITARRSGLILRGGSMRRETQWLALDPVTNTLAAGSTAVISNTMTAAELALRPFTVVRTIGIFSVESDQDAADEITQAGFGACVVSDQAVTVGVTAVPTPDTDRASDLWFMYVEAFARFQFLTAAGFHPHASVQKDFDSRAMRKVEEGSQIIFVKETSAIATGAIVRTAGRVLVKLH